MIYDIITYNGEKELLDLRFNILGNYVDKFVIIEFDKTFSGQPKPKRLIQDWTGEMDQFISKIQYGVITEPEYMRYASLADSSPNVPEKGPDHWKREFCQKESIKDMLFDLEDDDIVFLGDVDEIWDPELSIVGPHKLKLRVYSYYLDNRSNEQFWGTIVAQYSDIKDRCLNHVRQNDLPKTENECGWHFTSMGGYDRVKSKMLDTYTEDSYANPEVMSHLEESIQYNIDLLNRGFAYHIDQEAWPEYLKKNIDKYKHLLK